MCAHNIENVAIPQEGELKRHRWPLATDAFYDVELQDYISLLKSFSRPACIDVALIRCVRTLVPDPYRRHK